MSVLCLGVSYRHAPIELLERLAFGEEDLAKAYHHLEELDSVGGVVLLSTCNRVEVYAEVGGYHQGFQDLKRFLAESRDVAFEEFSEPLYAHYEDQAAEHLFLVAAGLDSMVTGEPQVLAQVRAAMKRAEAEGVAGSELGALFRQAVRAGRRVRSETAIGASPAAFVEAGAGLAARHLGGLKGARVLVVGAGKMSGVAVRSLRGHGVGAVRVLNRTPERAEHLAVRLGAEHGSLKDLVEALRAADLVVCSTGSTAAVVTRDAVTAAGPASRFFLDLAVPRDVEPAVGDLPGAEVADIDDLRETVARDRPGEEMQRARAIVQEEAAGFTARRRAARLAPLIRALHDRGEQVRSAELRRMAARLARLSDRDRETVEALTRGIVRTLLHDPVVRLKDLAGSGGADPQARALAELFGLDLPAPE